MSRIQILLSTMIALMLIVLFWFLLYSPKQEDLEQVEAQIEQEEALQQQLEARVSQLQEVRRDAPRAEARLAAATSMIPADAALPSALRQMQLAADESGLVLRSVSAARPGTLDGDFGLANVGLNVQLEGGYFQVVDFLRRVEDPTITPRAVMWNSVNMSVNEYPELIVSLGGSMFTLAPVEPEAEQTEDTETVDGEEQDPADVGPDADTQDEEAAG